MMRVLALSFAMLTLVAGVLPVSAQTGDDRFPLTENAVPAVGDTIVFGGPIYTGVDATPNAEAVVIAKGRFLFVGNLADAMAFSGDTTDLIDLQGAALYPGFVDGHAHLTGIGIRELSLNLEGTNTLSSFKARLRNWAEDHPNDPIIIGRGWVETFWEEGRFPTRWDLDDVVADRPVLLTRTDGHALVANSRALEISGITGATEAPSGGDIILNALDEPTGILIDKAMDLVADLRPRLSERRRLQALELGARIYAEYGWTGIHNMSVEWDDVLALEALNEAGALPLHVYNSINQDEARRLFTGGARLSENGRVITRAIKLYLDGALGSRGAALLNTYADSDTEGLMLIEKEEAVSLMAEALARGIQINSHAIGDRANRLALDWYEEVFRGLAPISRPVAEPRWRVEHAQIIAPLDITRFADLAVIPSMQPSHAVSDLYFAADRLGDARLDGAYAWRSLLDTGAIIAGGSDAPVERGNPLYEFYAAVSRKDLKGYQGADWRADERVTRAEALKMFTIWPAYAAHMDTERGSIEVGKRADLTAFADDLMVIDELDIPKTKPVLTIVDGETVFRDLGDEAALESDQPALDPE